MRMYLPGDVCSTSLLSQMCTTGIKAATTSGINWSIKKKMSDSPILASGKAYDHTHFD